MPQKSSLNGKTRSSFIQWFLQQKHAQQPKTKVPEYFKIIFFQFLLHLSQYWGNCLSSFYYFCFNFKLVCQQSVAGVKPTMSFCRFSHECWLGRTNDKSERNCNSDDATIPSEEYDYFRMDLRLRLHSNMILEFSERHRDFDDSIWKDVRLRRHHNVTPLPDLLTLFCIYFKLQTWNCHLWSTSHKLN